jgi:hypothetical protein
VDSLERYGFKIKIVPVYGSKQQIWKKSLLQFGPVKKGAKKSEEVQALQYLSELSSSITIMNVVINEMLSVYLKGNPLMDEENKYKELLQWDLIKRGLACIKKDLYLTENDEGQYLCKTKFSKSSEGQSEGEDKSFYSSLRDEITKQLFSCGEIKSGKALEKEMVIEKLKK